MATGPVKSQPLHNFSLSFLRWGGKNQTTTTSHRFRRSGAGESSAASDFSEVESDYDARIHSRMGSRNSRNRLAFTSSSRVDVSVMYSERGESPEGNEVKEGKHEGEDAEGEGEEIAQRPWNLRPRKGVSSKALIDLKNGGDSREPEVVRASDVDTVGQGSNTHPKSLRLRGLSESRSFEKKENRKFWIALSREEIEEDIFIMTSSRAARRPRKRPKNVQKQLDTIFPGLWLVGASADSFRVGDAPSKK